MPEDSKKKTVVAGQFTHWARPRWIRMYDYNYEYGESYYRPQVRYVSTSRYATESSSSAVDIRKAYLARRRALSPPRASSFIERWTSDPFYGYGFRAESKAMSDTRTRAQSEMRSRRAQSELNSSNSSNYASRNLLYQIDSARSSSASVQQQSQDYQQLLYSRRARSVSVARDTSYASDDCLMRSTAVDVRSSSVARSRRAQSYSSDLDVSSSQSRSVREGSLTRQTLNVDQNNVLRGRSLDGTIDYEYPRHHLVCTEKCPMFNDPIHHRRFVIGNKFGDAAALGGFDVLYDPSVYKKTRSLLQRFSQEKQIEATIYESSRETESQSRDSRSRSRLAYKTIY